MDKFGRERMDKEVKEIKNIFAKCSKDPHLCKFPKAIPQKVILFKYYKDNLLIYLYFLNVLYFCL